MKLTRRAATLAGLGALATGALSRPAMAIDGPLEDLVEGTEDLPPVKGFWSLTMYDEQMFFVANPINRYSMSLRANPKFESDGSLVIFV